MTTQALGQEGFRWFFGVVEDLNDPLQLGRVKVRVLNEHDNYVRTEDMHWSHMMMPVTSPSLHGSGDTPRLALGTNVVGFYIDTNEKQMTMIMGSMPIIPDMDHSKHSISSLARGKQVIEREITGPEPSSPYAAEYPYNRVISTPGGHVIELDDTPDNERIHLYHKSGSYIEIHPDGTVTQKAKSAKFDIVNNDHTHYVGGSYNVETPGGMMVKGSLGTDHGATGSFTSADNKTITVEDGIVTDIA